MEGNDMETKVSDGQAINCEADDADFDFCRDAVPDDSPAALAIAKALGQPRWIGCQGRRVPARWMWHGGRLLPALMLAAANHAGNGEDALPHLARGGGRCFLPWAVVGLPDHLLRSAVEVVEGLPVEAGLRSVDSLVADFFRDVVAPGGRHRGMGTPREECSDDLHWVSFVSSGVPFLTVAHQWWKER